MTQDREESVEDTRRSNIYIARHRAGYMGTVKADVSICGPYTTQFLIDRGWDRAILEDGMERSPLSTEISAEFFQNIGILSGFTPIPWTDLESLINAGVQMIFRNPFQAQEDAP